MKRETSLRGRLLLLAIAALVLGCQTPSRPPVEHEQNRTPVDHELKVVQRADGCPIGIDPPTTAECPNDGRKTCARKNDQLVWVADRPVRIYFDPFRGHEIKSPLVCGPCRTSPVKIDKDVPPADDDTVSEIEYKYTVVVDGCKEPYDPPIFIQK